MSLLRSISMSPLHKRRQRRSRLGTLCLEGGPDGIDMREVDAEGEDGKGQCTWTLFCVTTFELSPYEYKNTNKCLGHPGCGDLDNPGSPDREGGADRDAGAEGGNDGMADGEGLKGGAEETDDSKKRKRKPYRPGTLT